MDSTKKYKSFVIAKKEITVLHSVSIEKGAVGIVESTTDKKSRVFFIRAWQALDLNKSDFQIFDVTKTGDSFQKKICNICHKLLDTNLFAKNQNGINNRSVRRPSCSTCRKDLEGVNMTTKAKTEWNKTKPKNSPFECPICMKKTIAGITSKVVLDHNHKNGKPRGWVCDSCNTGIGRFKDDVDLIKRAIKYIK